MAQRTRGVLIGLVIVLVGLPGLLVATYAYAAYGPHLLLDPLNRALYDAPREADRTWRSVDVDLRTMLAATGDDRSAVLARLEGAGYRLVADYTNPVGPRDPNPEDDFTQADLDELFARARQDGIARGITHEFQRGGRFNIACGETFQLELGFADEVLTKANGYARWTCL